MSEGIKMVNQKNFYRFSEVFQIIAQQNCSNREDLKPVLKKISTNFLKKSICYFEKSRGCQSNLDTSVLSFEYSEDFEDCFLSISSHYIIRPVLDLIEKGFIKISLSNTGTISKESFVDLRSYPNQGGTCFYSLNGWRNSFKLECLTEFFTPKEDFDYFLKKGRRFCDSKEDTHGIILSKAWGDTFHVYKDFHLFVESVSNIMSYFEVINVFTLQGFRDWEIKFAIDYLIENRKLYLLMEKYVCDDGYCSIENPDKYCNVFLKKENYERFFFFKKQVEKILPKIYFDRYFTYKEVLNRWSINEAEINIIISELVDPDDIWTRMSLKGRINFPRHSISRMPYQKVLTEQIKLKFIKSAIFPERYLKEVEKYYNIPITTNFLSPKQQKDKPRNSKKVKIINEKNNVKEKKVRKPTLFNQMAQQKKKDFVDANSMWNWLSEMAKKEISNIEKSKFMDTWQFIEFRYDDTIKKIIWASDNSKKNSKISKKHFINKSYQNL